MTSGRVPSHPLLARLAKLALASSCLMASLLASACGGDGDDPATRRSVRIERFPASGAYPNGHFEVRDPSGEPVEGAFELWLCELGDDSTPTGRRASLPDGRPAPPVVGKLHRTTPVVVFEPRQPLRPRTWYEGVFTPRDGTPRSSIFVQVPAQPAEPETRITVVYPTADALPENLLRFHVQFSGPMQRGEAYEHVHLLDAAGDVVEEGLLPMRPELWDPESTRLTLLLDPARIGSGLPPLETLAPRLEEGATYTLRIDPTWRDAAGVELVAGYEKTFVVVEADRRSPDPGSWLVRTPRPGTRDPLQVEFDEPLDRALLERMLFVEDKDGNVVHGTGRPVEGEVGWEYVPDEPWGLGGHELVVDPQLADPAGNGLSRLYGEPATPDDDEAGPPEDAPLTRVPFEVTPTDAD